ncbi:hypothetical protein V6N12_023541 [Hibiscus sabdariffa]|uniref:Secreted protein n=1 Tax=Hibiscus sabdariffa TaxID=183260 RepID=A0ABR2FXZ6_9ROSI
MLRRDVLDSSFGVVLGVTFGVKAAVSVPPSWRLGEPPPPCLCSVSALVLLAIRHCHRFGVLETLKQVTTKVGDQVDIGPSASAQLSSSVVCTPRVKAQFDEPKHVV